MTEIRWTCIYLFYVTDDIVLYLTVVAGGVEKLEGLVANQLVFVSRLFASSRIFRDKIPNKSWISLLLNISGQNLKSGRLHNW